jgi:hypothetical protein
MEWESQGLACQAPELVQVRSRVGKGAGAAKKVRPIIESIVPCEGVVRQRIEHVAAVSDEELQ